MKDRAKENRDRAIQRAKDELETELWNLKNEFGDLPADAALIAFAEQRCGLAIDNAEKEYQKAVARRIKARANRRAMGEAMDSIGMKRVRGNMGGSYWE